MLRYSLMCVIRIVNVKEMGRPVKNKIERKTDIVRFRITMDKKISFDVRRLMKTNKNINSVRRAITNLTEDGYLLKTSERRMGEEGKMNYCWRFNLGCLTGHQTELFD